ncbi:class I SAM-dependent methyltransferase [Candidatus Peregrinibacteria bacterium]|nr:class I SAM-dependent methyltransferase [Candidatus Peregrinibacteria bacterium]
MPQKSKRYDRFDKRYYSTDGYEGYEEWHEDIARENIIDPLFTLIRPEASWTFLDVGCGMGGTILDLRKRGFQAFGTEVSAHCLETSPAKEWMGFGESFALPQKDRSFDVVICCDMFQYLTKEQAMQSIGELARVARQYVSLWVFDPAAPSWSDTENPDDVRKNDTKGITNDDYAQHFAAHGMESIAMEVDFTEDSGVPEWHLLFKK